MMRYDYSDELDFVETGPPSTDIRSNEVSIGTVMGGTRGPFHTSQLKSPVFLDDPTLVLTDWQADGCFPRRRLNPHRGNIERSSRGEYRTRDGKQGVSHTGYLDSWALDRNNHRSRRTSNKCEDLDKPPRCTDARLGIAQSWTRRQVASTTRQDGT